MKDHCLLFFESPYHVAQVFSGHPNLELLSFFYIQGKQYPYLL